jgi:DNA invertase Pin-like site-specific DNA recombinase
MLTVLGGLAEFERELIKARAGESKTCRSQNGAQAELSAHQITEVRDRKRLGESVRFLARSYGVSPNTISRVR